MSRQGAFLWAVRPGAFAQDGLFDTYAAHWVSEFRSRGGDAARLPGQRAARLEQQHRELGIELAPLPGYSPDLMPVEALWRWLREDVTYHYCHPTADDPGLRRGRL